MVQFDSSFSDLIWLTFKNSIHDSKPSVTKHNFIFNSSYVSWLQFDSHAQILPPRLEKNKIGIVEYYKILKTKTDLARPL